MKLEKNSEKIAGWASFFVFLLEVGIFLSGHGEIKAIKFLRGIPEISLSPMPFWGSIFTGIFTGSLFFPLTLVGMSIFSQAKNVTQRFSIALAGLIFGIIAGIYFLSGEIMGIILLLGVLSILLPIPGIFLYLTFFSMAAMATFVFPESFFIAVSLMTILGVKLALRQEA